MSAYKNPLKLKKRFQSTFVDFESWLGTVASVAVFLLLLLSIFLMGSDDDLPLAQIPFKVYEAAEKITPEQAKETLRRQDLQELLSTKRSTNSFWVLLSNEQYKAPSSAVEFNSRHLVNGACFDAKTFENLGSVNRMSHLGQMEQFRSGFLLRSAKPWADVVCEFGFVGPAKLEMKIWSDSDLIRANRSFHARANLLDGAAISLTIFALIVSVVSRSYLYFIFAAWLIVSFRVAGLSLGTDYWWLGHALNGEVAVWSRKVALSLNSLLSMALLTNMFAREFFVLRLRAIAHAMVFSAASLFAVSFFIDYNSFLPLLWSQIGTCCLATLYVLFKINWYQPSATVRLYSVGWAISALAVIAEILCAALGVRSVPWFLNSVTGALGSSFLISIALAAKLRDSQLATIASENRAVEALIKYQETYDTVPVGLFTLCYNGSVSKYNPQFAAMFEIERNTFPRWNVLIPSLPVSRFNQTDEGFFEFSKNDGGGHRWFEIQTKRQGSNVEGTITEITERKLGEEQLAYAANFDQLTGLHNRHYMILHLDSLLAQGSGPTSPIAAMAMIDIQRFHQVVTYFGHATGDEILCKVRDRILSIVPSSTMVGRLSADTFVLIFKDSSLAAARDSIQAVLDNIHNTAFSSNEKSFNLSVRAGVIGLDTSMSSKDALTACDSAMQDAKARGGACLVAYVDQDPAWISHKAETDLMAQFSVRIPFERMQMLYQPIVSLANPAQSMGYEALIRLRAKDGCLISPAHFIPALEKNGMMSQLDRWVVRTVFEFLEAHPTHFEALTYCAVNLSGASLNDEHFLDEILKLAADHPRTVQKICFEITETVAIADIASTKRFVDNIKSLGARIALDDFGAGYSSFAYLAQLGADFLKIDGNLVKGLTVGTPNFAIVKAIADLGRSLNMKVVAEWVEDAATLEALLKIGVNAGQGWCLGMPMSAKAMATYTDGAAFIQNSSVRTLLGLDARRQADLEATATVLA